MFFKKSGDDTVRKNIFEEQPEEDVKIDMSKYETMSALILKSLEGITHKDWQIIKYEIDREFVRLANNNVLIENDEVSKKIITKLNQQKGYMSYILSIDDIPKHNFALLDN